MGAVDKREFRTYIGFAFEDSLTHFEELIGLDAHLERLLGRWFSDYVSIFEAFGAAHLP